jgi:hypothetical protein
MTIHPPSLGDMKRLSVIIDEIMTAINQFYNLNQQGLQWLNNALVVLVPKKANAQRVSDFKPISLIHSFAKLI